MPLDAAYFERIKAMSVKQLYNYKGDVVPWPITDEDVVWWGRLIDDLHEEKMKRNPQAENTTHIWRPPNWTENGSVYGLLGQCHFGMKYGLEPGDLGPWPQKLYYDYLVMIFGRKYTIDVKTTTSQVERGRVCLPFALKSIEYKIEKRKPFCDIYVGAWMPGRELTMGGVDLLGWAWKDELLNAPIYDWGHAEARGILSGDLRPIETLINMIYPPKFAREQMPLFNRGTYLRLPPP